jgi:hypothetical protein
VVWEGWHREASPYPDHRRFPVVRVRLGGGGVSTHCCRSCDSKALSRGRLIGDVAGPDVVCTRPGILRPAPPASPRHAAPAPWTSSSAAWAVIHKTPETLIGSLYASRGFSEPSFGGIWRAVRVRLLLYQWQRVSPSLVTRPGRRAAAGPRRVASEWGCQFSIGSDCGSGHLAADTSLRN